LRTRTPRTRRLVAALAVVGLALTACGGGDDETTDTASPGAGGGDNSDVKVGLAYDIGGRGDQSFNDAAAAGLEKAKAELGVDVREAEAAAGETDAAKEERLRVLASSGFDPVIAVGFAYSGPLAKVAAEFPDVTFAIVDDAAAEADNISNLVFAEEQGSFLVGAAAALKSENKHVGFLGGVNNDLIKKFEAGFTAGARAVEPKIKVDVKYLTEDPNDTATAFENPAGGKTAAEGLYDGGADVVYHAAGKSGLGLFEAAADRGDGFWAIGVDSDQYLTAEDAQKKHILTSMLKRVDTAVFDTIKAVDEDSFTSTSKSYDLAADGVGYSTSNSAVKAYTAKADEFKQKIISGQITVPDKP